MEALRWQPVLPLGMQFSVIKFVITLTSLGALAVGVPHFLATEDTYKGYRIPAGSIVMANSWCVQVQRISLTVHRSICAGPFYTMK
jgi:hypothetical protein